LHGRRHRLLRAGRGGLAGYLFDLTGGYSVALSTAAVLGTVSAGAVLPLFRRERENAAE
jgi:hypothetical protein